MMVAMPFPLEGELNELNRVSGGKCVKTSEPWSEKVIVPQCAGLGGMLITGQNPDSTAGVAKEILKALGL